MSLLVGTKPYYASMTFEVMPPETMLQLIDAAKMDDQTPVYYFPIDDMVGTDDVF